MKRLLIVLMIFFLITACTDKHYEEKVYNCRTVYDMPPVNVELLESSTTTVLENGGEGEINDEITKTTFRVTAYCACEKCCGVWASKRPLDENGNPIVYGASGVELVNGVSCASPLPFGTQIELDGYGVVEVQDRTADWVVNKFGENLIDIYMNNHEAARNFGLQYIEGVVK